MKTKINPLFHLLFILIILIWNKGNQKIETMVLTSWLVSYIIVSCYEYLTNK